jgi:hypothetical protein
MTVEKLKRQLTIVSAKVSPDELHSIDTSAELSGMNRSAYVRALLFQQNQKFREFSQLPTELIVKPEHANETEKHIQALQKSYPNLSGSEIILCALKVALEQQDRTFSFKIKNVL